VTCKCPSVGQTADNYRRLLVITFFRPTVNRGRYNLDRYWTLCTIHPLNIARIFSYACGMIVLRRLHITDLTVLLCNCNRSVVGLHYSVHRTVHSFCCIRHYYRLFLYVISIGRPTDTSLAFRRWLTIEDRTRMFFFLIAAVAGC